ncbi:TDT family transporter [Vibrio sp.]|nr:TDT family transporter [Vibrio sp.]
MLNWKRFTQFQTVPPAQAALALAIISLGQAWSLYIPSIGEVIRPYLAGLGAVLLLPVILRYLLHPRLFKADIAHPLQGSLMAPMTMGLLILCDYLAVVSKIIAYPLWFGALILHVFLMLSFFLLQIKKFKITNLVPSWFLYPIGIISSSLAGSQFGHTVFSESIVNICIALYFFMLPLMLYRLVFEGKLPRNARPTLAIMAAPINLSLTAYLVNNPEPDPILTGALGGIAITMTLLIYLCYVRLIRLKFQPSMAALTFPSVISAVAMFRLTDYFAQHHQQWHWLHRFGMFELTIATVLVIWVALGYLKMYWPEFFYNPSKSHDETAGR